MSQARLYPKTAVEKTLTASRTEAASDTWFASCIANPQGRHVPSGFPVHPTYIL